MNDTLIVHVEPNYHSDHVWVLVPPKFWSHQKLANCIKKAIEETQRSATSEVSDEERPDA